MNLCIRASFSCPLPCLTSLTVNCHIKCDWQWFWPNYVRLSLPQYFATGRKDSGNRLIGIPYRLAMIGQWARLFTQLTTFRTMTCFGESNGSAVVRTAELNSRRIVQEFSGADGKANQVGFQNWPAYRTRCRWPANPWTPTQGAHCLYATDSLSHQRKSHLLSVEPVRHLGQTSSD